MVASVSVPYDVSSLATNCAAESEKSLDSDLTFSMVSAIAAGSSSPPESADTSTTITTRTIGMMNRFFWYHDRLALA